MLRAVRTEADSSRRRFSPHFRFDTTPPTYALVAYPPHLKFLNNTCRYDGERASGFPLVWCIYGCRRFSRDSCRVQWVLSPALIVVIFFQRDLFISRYVLVARRGCRPDCFSFFFCCCYEKLCQIESRKDFLSLSRSDSAENKSSLCGRMKTI